ncbi:MAG: hypothetical protein JKY41_05020 [Rhodobacteraceae bacterium]|nr:hypothetical protein [Paracoccaceae bacterium]
MQKSDKMGVKVKLSTLWIVVMFNMAYADILALNIPGMEEELAAFAGDTPISLLMLVGAIIIQVPVGMIFLSRYLDYKANRRANIAAGAFVILFIVGGGSLLPHYLFIATIEVLCVLLIMWTAWKWPESESLESG